MSTEKQFFDNSFSVEDAAKAMYHTPEMKQSAYQAQNLLENLEVDSSAVHNATKVMPHSSQQQEELYKILKAN